MAGYIKLHRVLLECSLFTNEKALKIWIWCLLKASHKEHKQMIGRQEITLLPGQFIFGRKVAAEELNLSESTVWSLMQDLQRSERINIKSNNKFSLVTVVNWDFYQLKDEDSDSNTDNKWTTNGQQKDTNKNGKKGKNENNIYTPEFETFWEVYPRKESKTTALKCWNARITQGESPDNMIAGARGYAASCRTKGTETKYIKLPSTFIGPDKHYLDHLTTEQPQTNILQQLFPGNSFPQYDD